MRNLCVVVPCGKEARTNSGESECSAHQMRRLRKYSTWSTGGFPDITYSGMHHKVRRVLGSSTLQSCVSCGSDAGQWAYTHDAVNELEEIEQSGYTVRYSADVNDYQPMCVPCHKNFDKDRVSV